MAIRIVRLALYAIIGFWGFASFAMLASEENPEQPLELSDFIMVKLGALTSLGLCLFCGYLLDKSGLLPFKSNRV